MPVPDRFCKTARAALSCALSAVLAVGMVPAAALAATSESAVSAEISAGEPAPKLAAAAEGEEPELFSVDLPQLRSFAYSGSAKSLLRNAVVAGGDHSAYVTLNGDLCTFGRGNLGQLGNGGTSNGREPIKIASNVASVALGYEHSAYITRSGDLYMFGYNWRGQLGDGTTETRCTPVKIASNVASVALGNYHSAFVTASGDLYTFGRNDNGQLGVGDKTDRLAPTKVASGVANVYLGYRHTGYTTKTGDLYMFGYNAHGQLGNNDTLDVSAPIKVASGVADVFLGYDTSSYLTADGTLYSFGRNQYGQLGVDDTTDRRVPVKVASDVASVSMGGQHSGYITTSGDLYTYGYNNYRQLGYASKLTNPTPSKVASDVVAFSAGWHHSACILGDGEVLFFGDNQYSQLTDTRDLTEDGFSRVASVAGQGIQLLSGSTIQAANAGTYSVVLGLKGGFTWSDGTTAPKKIAWSIAKAAQAISAPKVAPATNYNGTLSRTVSAIKGASAKGAMSFSKVSAVLALDGAAGKAGTSFANYFSLVTSVDAPGTCQIKVAPKTPVGTYTVKIRVTAAATANYNSASKDVSVTVKVSRFGPTIHILGKVVRTAKYSAVKLKAVTVDCPVTKIQCASKPMSYKLSSAKDSSGLNATACFKVNAATGAVTVAKGTPKGSYTVNIKVMSDDNANYKGNYKVVACTVKVS